MAHTAKNVVSSGDAPIQARGRGPRLGPARMIGIKFPLALFEKVDQAAMAEQRSYSSMVRILVERALEQ